MKFSRMPVEYRLIQFRDAELEMAVDRWLRANGELDQYSRAGHLVPAEHGKKVSISAECWDARGRARKNLQVRTLDHEEVKQALVLYCKDFRIPLAQSAKKILRMLDKKISIYYGLK